MEKLVRSQITKTRKATTRQTIWFSTRQSTTLQLLKVLDVWTEAVDRRKKVDVIYLDFRKTFVSVPHIRLINKLEQYGNRGKNLQWIEQYLKSREQRVSVNQEKTLSSAGFHRAQLLVQYCFFYMSTQCQTSYTQNFSSIRTTRSCSARYQQLKIKDYYNRT